VVDNGCTDFSPGAVAALAPGAQYVRTDTNLGFAGGANAGMRRALADGAEYVWFVNNDAAPEPQSLAALLTVATAAPHVGVFGPKILQADGPQRIDSVAIDVNLRTGRVYLTGHDELDRGQYDGLSTVTAVTGVPCSCGALRANVLAASTRASSRTSRMPICVCARQPPDTAWQRCPLRVSCTAVPRHRRPPIDQQPLLCTRNHLRLMERHGKGSGPRRQVRTLTVVALNLLYALRSEPQMRRERLRAVWRGVTDYRRGVTGAATF